MTHLEYPTKMKRRAKYVPSLAGVLILLAFTASIADGKTHQRGLFFILERLVLVPLALAAVASFAAAFHSKEERAQDGVLFLVSLPTVAAASVILGYAAYAVYRMVF